MKIPKLIDISELPNIEIEASDGKRYVLLPFKHLSDIPTVDAVVKPNCRDCLYYYKVNAWNHCEHCIGSSINAFVPYKPGDATK